MTLESRGIDQGLADEELVEALRGALGAGDRAKTIQLSEELARRLPDSFEAQRTAAEAAEEVGEFLVAARRWKRLRDSGITPRGSRMAVAVAYTRCLALAGAVTQAESEVAFLEITADGAQDAELAAELWWMLRAILAESKESNQTVRAKAAGVRAIEAFIKAIELTHDDSSRASILARTWTRVVEQEPDLTRPSESFMDLLARAIEDNSRRETRDLAALLLSPIEPGWVLAQEPPAPRSARMIEARARARMQQDQPALAAQEFDELGLMTGPIGKLPVRSLLRLQWVQALVEAGRLRTAEHESERAVGELQQALAESHGQLEQFDSPLGRQQRRNTVRRDPSAAARHEERRQGLLDDIALLRQLLAYYTVQVGRVAGRAGMFDQAWKSFRDACDIDVGDDALLRGAVSSFQMVMATTAARGVAHLKDIWRLAEQNGATRDGFPETGAIEAGFWLASRWEGHEGGWDEACRSSGEGSQRVRGYLAGARSRGLVLAREVLSRTGGDGGWDHIEQRLRLALLAGDELLAQDLNERWEGDARNSWAGRVLRAVCYLQAGQEQDKAALDLMREVMAERRFDLDLRVLYAHTALLAGEVNEAAQECLEILEMAPEHVLARVVRAECSFEMALSSHGAKTSRGDPEGSEAAAMENVHQLIGAVRDYRYAILLDARTKRFFQDETLREGEPLGSDILTPKQVVQVCRRGLHAAIIAQEGVDRLGLERDAAMEAHARGLVVVMRSHTRAQTCAVCDREMPTSGRSPGPVAREWHEWRRHRRDRDEVARLTGLLTNYRHAKWSRLGQSALVVALGVVVLLCALLDLPLLAEIFPSLEHAAVVATMTAVGLALISFPFVRSVKLGGLEFQRPDRAPPLTGRSKALRASAVLQRNALLSTSTAILPVAVPAPADPGASAMRNLAFKGARRATSTNDPLDSARDLGDPHD